MERCVDVVVYRTRGINAIVSREIERLRSELPDYAIAVVSYQWNYVATDGDRGKPQYCYSQQDLEGLPYPRKKRDLDWRHPIGGNDLPALKFYRDHPEYDAYWVIEDDVRFSGPWHLLFDELRQSAAALLMTAVEVRRQNPAWHWWPSLVTADDELPDALMTKGFGPFLRASNACLAAIDRKYQAGWGGHAEVTWPTACRAAGLGLEDIGGNGAFTPSARRDRFYSNTPANWHLFPGTFVYRPAFRETGVSEFAGGFFGQPMLWHPVKSSTTPVVGNRIRAEPAIRASPQAR
jgi:hypothetical protein